MHFFMASGEDLRRGEGLAEERRNVPQCVTVR